MSSVLSQFQQKQVDTCIERVVKSLNANVSLQRLERLLQRLEEREIKTSDAHFCLLQAETDHDPDQLMAELVTIQKQLCGIQKQINNAISRKHSDTADIKNSPNNPDTAKRSVQLPTVQLPTFDGR